MFSQDGFSCHVKRSPGLPGSILTVTLFEHPCVWILSYLKKLPSSLNYTTTIYFRFHKCSNEKTTFICCCSSATARAYLGDRRHRWPHQHSRRRPRRCLHRQTSRAQVKQHSPHCCSGACLRITPSCNNNNNNNNNNSDFVCTNILEDQA